MDKIAEYVPATKAREIEIEILLSLILSGLIAFFFYRSFWGLLSIVPVWFFVKKILSDEFEKRRRNRCLAEFKEMLMSVSSSLRAGHSIENAIRDLEHDFSQIYGENSLLSAEISLMAQKLSLRLPVEQAFVEFADAFGYEEMQSFAFMLSFAKRLGGNYVKNVRDAADKLSTRLELKRDIEASLGEKRLELRVMVAMPIAIIIYIGLTSYDFISGLYHNFAGVIIMTFCLLLYAGCILLGERIVNIEY